MHSIALEIVDRANTSINGQFMEICAPQPRELRIGIREKAALQQRIVGKVNSRHEMTGMKSHLFGFGKEIVRVAVEYQLSNDLNRHLGLWNKFGGVENVEAQFGLLASVDELDTQLPFRKISTFNSFPEFASVKVRIHAGYFLCLVPSQPVHAQLRFPVKFDKAGVTPGIGKPEGMNPEPFHHSQTSRQCAVRHCPHEHVRGFRHQRCEIPERIVGAGCLRHFVMRFRLERMN